MPFFAKRARCLLGKTAQIDVTGLVNAVPYNERILYAEVAFQSILAAGAISYLSVFLTRLGASNWLVTAYSSLPALLTILFAIPAGVFVQGRSSLVRTANWGRFIYRAVVGLSALLPLFTPSTAAIILVTAYSIIAIPGLVSNIAFTTILGQATSPERRPRMLSTRMAVNGFVASIVGFMSGRWLTSSPYPFNYQALFVVGFLAGLASIYTFSRIKIDRQTFSRPEHGQLRLTDLFKAYLHEPRFRKWSLVAVFFRIAIAMPQALYVIYKVRELGATDAWLGVLILVENGLSVLAYFLMARFSTKARFNRYFCLSLVGTALYPLTMALAKTPEMLIIPSVCSAVFSAALNIFISNTLYKVLPQRQQSTFIAADTLLANGAAFIGPLLGTMLANQLGLVSAFLVIAVLRVLTATSFWVFKVGTD